MDLHGKQCVVRSIPAYPNPGEKITASLLREILRELRANTPLEGSNVLLQRTPNGTHIHAKPAGRGGSAANRLDCFDLSRLAVDADAGTVTCVFERRFFRVGGRTWEKDPDLQTGEESSTTASYPCVVGLEITWTDEGTENEEPNATYSNWATMADLKEAEKDVKKYVLPLYRFDDEGKMDVDFRNAPTAQMGEFA